jgi:hypothetical protein
MPEIDDVVRAVHADTPRMTDESFAAGRERVLAGRRRPRPWGRFVGVATSAAVLVAAALIVPTLGGDQAPQAASAATVLTKAANMIQTHDVTLTPGQFRYVRTESTMLSRTERCEYRQHDTDEIWIPQDPEAEWLLRRDRGRIEWLTCEDPDWDGLPKAYQQEYRAKYGTFVLDSGANPTPEPGWYNLTPQFLASLPRDPQALFTLIEQEYASGTAEPSKAYFQHATQLLFSAALPADLRAALYQAMTRIQGIEITDEFATIDGRTGTAIGLTMGAGKGIREDIVIDPQDGTLIGRRSLDLDGSLIGTDVITNGITERIGEAPLR